MNIRVEMQRNIICINANIAKCQESGNQKARDLAKIIYKIIHT